jgi:CDP-diacylglycerol--glycerol-3-phosphate 3-phosphatidyltransferase
LLWRTSIPWSLIIIRLLLGPLLALAAFRTSTPEPWLGLLFLAGPVSDIFDGVLARRFGTDTAALRISDTIVDIVFYIFVLMAIITVNAPAIRHRIWLIAAVIALEAVRLLVDMLKFHRIASYHAYSAKLFGLLLMLAVGWLLCFRRDTWLVTAALVWGIVSELEGLAFSILLPEWVHDVKSLPRALAIRRELLQNRTARVPAH